MSKFRFGPFQFDAALPELRRRDQPVAMQVMPLRLLDMLLRRPGQLVTREEFFAALWPDDQSGLLDDNLNTAIRKLRLALDDSAQRPRYIETVPKRGYRFVADVETARGSENSADEMTAGSEPATATQSGRRWPAVLAVAALLLAGVLLMRDDFEPSSVPAGHADTSRTVAVLRFVNATGDEDRQYFSDGLSEEVMDRLSGSAEIRVVSRTSAFAAGNAGLGARDLGQSLGADALVEGSVRGDSEQLRISVRLVDTATGLQLWSQRYDRPMAGVFDVQDEIAAAIVNTLTGAELDDTQAKSAAVDPVAYDHYLQGRYAWHRRSRDGLLAAVEHFNAATRLAPGYAAAWAGLADGYAVLGFYDYMPPSASFPRARDAAERALQIEPRNADAEANLGYVALYYDWNLRNAERHFLRAIELQPDSSKAHQWYANLLTAAGRFAEAEREMRRAQQLEPLSIIASAALGWVRYFAGLNDAALAQLDLTLGLDPNFELVYLWKGWVFEEQGQLDLAIENLKQAVVRSGNSLISTASLARAHALDGDLALARKQLENIESSDSYVPAYEVAKAWIAAGEPARAMAWFERAYEERSHSLVFLRVDPQLASASGDPDLRAFIDKVLPVP